MYFENEFQLDDFKKTRGQPELLGLDVAVGCSYTYGDGVDPDQAWPSLLNTFNLGQGGSSNDSIMRRLVHYINRFNDVKNVYILWTHRPRREYIDTNSNEFCTFYPNLAESPRQIDTGMKLAFMVLQNKNYDEYNILKNKFIVESICKVHNINLFQLEIINTDPFKFGVGSDGSHPDHHWHRHVADMFINMKRAHNN